MANYFLSTYQKDYIWPDCKSIIEDPHHGKKKIQSGGNGQVELKCVNDACQCVLKTAQVKQEASGGHIEHDGGQQEDDWSRIGPMGPLLDAKLFPAKTPSLMGEPTLETRVAIDGDSMVSTYQKDYTLAATYKQPVMPSTIQAEYTNPRSTGNICHPPIRVFNRDVTKNYIPKVIDESQFKLEGGAGGQPAISPYGKSEYQDNISRLGAKIIAEKLIKPIKKKKFW